MYLCFWMRPNYSVRCYKFERANWLGPSRIRDRPQLTENEFHLRIECDVVMHKYNPLSPSKLGHNIIVHRS